MPISQQAASRAERSLQETPPSGQLKPRQSRADFGGPDSYRLKVRRIGRDYPFGDDVRDGDFGIYLGLHDEGYLVALQRIFIGEFADRDQNADKRFMLRAACRAPIRGSIPRLRRLVISPSPEPHLRHPLPDRP